MTEFIVTWEETVSYQAVVQAEDAEAARDMAIEGELTSDENEYERGIFGSITVEEVED